MQTITVYTLLDITETGVVRSFKKDVLPFISKDKITITNEVQWRFARQQQSNLEVLMQLLSLRAQPMHISGPTVRTKQALSKYNFDKKYKGKHTVWVLEFKNEASDVLSIDHDPVGALVHDFNSVPMLVNLNETIKNADPYFNTNTENIYFEVTDK